MGLFFFEVKFNKKGRTQKRQKSFAKQFLVLFLNHEYLSDLFVMIMPTVADGSSYSRFWGAAVEILLLQIIEVAKF